MSKSEHKTNYCGIGGQALIEGIMMCSPNKNVICVRAPGGDIYQETLDSKRLKEKYNVFSLPFFRGLAAFIDSMKIGYKALIISAEKSGFDDEIDSKSEQSENKSSEESATSNESEEGKKEDNSKIMTIVSVLASVLGIILAAVLFFYLPSFLFNQFAPQTDSVILRSVCEGGLRVIIFLCYLALCSKIPYMGRLFAYHGAEHKTIFCYEHNEELILENVKKFKRFHPRCGTSFIIISLIVGVIIGFFIPFSDPILRAFVKILCLPIVLGLGYELIRICGKHDNIFTKIIAAPGLWVQHLTTKEPDEDMIEVAIQALKAVIPSKDQDAHRNDI